MPTTFDFVEFLKQWQAYMLLHPQQRKGQALLNCLHYVGRTDLYTQVDDMFDIFYNDKEINQAIGYLSTIK